MEATLTNKTAEVLKRLAHAAGDAAYDLDLAGDMGPTRADVTWWLDNILVVVEEVKALRAAIDPNTPEPEFVAALRLLSGN